MLSSSSSMYFHWPQRCLFILWMKNHHENKKKHPVPFPDSRDYDDIRTFVIFSIEQTNKQTNTI